MIPGISDNYSQEFQIAEELAAASSTDKAPVFTISRQQTHTAEALARSATSAKESSTRACEYLQRDVIDGWNTAARKDAALVPMPAAHSVVEHVKAAKA